jgi:hypothetical protein
VFVELGSQKSWVELGLGLGSGMNLLKVTLFSILWCHLLPFLQKTSQDTEHQTISSCCFLLSLLPWLTSHLLPMPLSWEFLCSQLLRCHVLQRDLSASLLVQRMVRRTMCLSCLWVSSDSGSSSHMTGAYWHLNFPMQLATVPAWSHEHLFYTNSQTESSLLEGMTWVLFVEARHHFAHVQFWVVARTLHQTF